MVVMDAETEYQWLEMVVSDNTVDSPFWPSLGELTHLLSKEIARIEEARLQEKEIETRRVAVAGTVKVRNESTYPTENVMNILVQLTSQAPEGIASALIITLANDLRSLSKLFHANRSKLNVCDVGPLIGEVRWVDLVISASNYIRHEDEWREAASNRKRPTNQQKHSVEPLTKSGLNVWDKNPPILEVAKHLQIDRWDNLFKNLSDWLSECMPSHPGHSTSVQTL